MTVMSFFSMLCVCLLFVTSTARYNSRMYGRGHYNDAYSYGRPVSWNPRWEAYGHPYWHRYGYRRNLLSSGQELAADVAGKDLESDDENRRELDAEEDHCPVGFELTFDYHDGECQQDVKNEGETRADGEANNDKFACALACSNDDSCFAFDYKEGYCYLNERCDKQDKNDGYLSCKKSPISDPLSLYSSLMAKHPGWNPYGWGMSGNNGYNQAAFNPSGPSGSFNRYAPGYYHGVPTTRFYDDLNMDDWFDSSFYDYNRPNFRPDYNTGYNRLLAGNMGPWYVPQH